MKRYYVGLCALVTALALSGCGTNDDRKTELPPAPTVAQPDAVRNSQQVSLEAEVKKAEEEAAKKLEAIKAEALSKPKLDDRLSVIITAACRTVIDDPMSIKPANSDLTWGLAKLYDEQWRAGGKWSWPLWTAVTQQGACPGQPPTAPGAGG